MLKHGLIATVACSMAVFTSLPVTAADSDERQAILEAMQSWERAVEAGDFKSLSDHYMEHAIYYPHNAMPLVGREAIIDRNRQRGAAATVEISQQVDDLQVHHDWAIYSCLARIRMSGTEGAEETIRHVRVLLVMQKDVDGEWKILRDIDNGTPETL